MGKYDAVTSEEFDAMIIEIAKDNIDHTLSLPGVYEAISEEYNNEALDRIISEKQEKRREHLTAMICARAQL
jgi:hypothetical protein